MRFRPFLLVLLLLAALLPSVNASITVKQDVIFRTVDNNARFVMGSDFNFHKVEVNSTHAWMDKSYTSGYYTRYCIYVNSPNNVNFTVTKWFPTKDSEAKITIDAPSSTNINLGFQSPNLLTASALGVVSQTWFSANKTLLMVANTDTSSIITITVTVSETKEDNIAPENYAVVITDMDAGNWVFSETEYYTFQARYWDGNGYADLDTVKIKFSEAINEIIAVYDQVTGEWNLESGSNVVNLQAGTTTIIDSNLLQVTFLIYFENTILDALDVDLYMWCNDTSGVSDGWDEMQTDYFNIFNLGGHSTLETSGDAGRLDGGSAFDLYAMNNSWAEANITFKHLQHIKMLPIFRFKLLAINPSRLLQYRFWYQKEGDDNFVQALRLDISWQNSSTNPRYTCFKIRWYSQYQGGMLQEKVEYVYFFQYDEAYAQTNQTIQFWVDLWIGGENASSVIRGRINAYYFPIQDTANDWLKWFTGSNWGLYERRKQSMFTTTIYDDDQDRSVVYARQIQLVKISCLVDQGLVTSEDPLFSVSEYDVFDLTFGRDPFEGVQTPPFDETRMPQMTQGGFLGAIWTALNNFAKSITDFLGPAVLGFWTTFVGFLDTLASWTGIPNLFTLGFEWIGSLFGWIVDAVTWIITSLTAMFTFLAVTLTKGLSVVTTTITSWVLMIQNALSLISGGFGQTYNIFADLRLDIWITIIGIFYVVYLFAIWDEDGTDALLRHINMVINVFAFIINILLSVVQFFWSLITGIIEAIPFIEAFIPIVPFAYVMATQGIPLLLRIGVGS